MSRCSTRVCAEPHHASSDDARFELHLWPTVGLSIDGLYLVSRLRDRRDLAVIGRVVRQMIQPSIELDGPPAVEVVRRRQNGREIIHLLNASGMQLASDYSAIDYVPPVPPMKIRVRFPRRPEKVTLEPGGRELPGAWDGSLWSATLPPLAIHTQLVA